jgi:polysaccharide pyruvyl transferase CsaB
VNFLLSGYYGYANAGDEAVLAAMLEHLSALRPQSTFTVTSGDPAYTERLHIPAVRAIPRQNPKTLVPSIRACDVFISGGGSLLQDVTSLRNVVYYTSLIRFAQLSRKPVIIYAQGVGPLNKPLSQKLARAAMQKARIITLRDEESKALLERIGVRRNVQVTADPVWALEVQSPKPKVQSTESAWCVSLRSWPHEVDEGAMRLQKTVQALRVAAHAAKTRLRFLPMQMERDAPLSLAAGAREDEIIDVTNRHPRDIMGEAGACQVMIAMRLHALIFAAAQGVPCVAINYDPKVASLAKILGAPLLEAADVENEDAVRHAIEAARVPDSEAVQHLREQARLNAQLAMSLMKS